MARGKEEEGEEEEMSPIQSRAHVGPDRMGTGAVSWGPAVWGSSGRGLWVRGGFGSTGLGYSTDSVVRSMLLR